MAGLIVHVAKVLLVYVTLFGNCLCRLSFDGWQILELVIRSASRAKTQLASLIKNMGGVYKECPEFIKNVQSYPLLQVQLMEFKCCEALLQTTMGSMDMKKKVHSSILLFWGTE